MKTEVIKNIIQENLLKIKTLRQEVKRLQGALPRVQQKEKAESEKEKFEKLGLSKEWSPLAESGLTAKEIYVLTRRAKREHYKTIGMNLGLSASYTRAILEKAARKLRHPTRIEMAESLDQEIRAIVSPEQLN
jgi:DNA-directed RNA polymerase sigma subunit (sigma70/sigma32)